MPGSGPNYGKEHDWHVNWLAKIISALVEIIVTPLDACLLIAGVSQVVSSLVQLSLLLPSCGHLGSCMLTALKRVIIGRPGLGSTTSYDH